MSNLDLSSKYLNLEASKPWPQMSGTRFTNAYMADFDNDGCDEVIAISPDCPGLLPRQLGVFSFFTYGSIAPEWYDSKEQGQLITTDLSSMYTISPDFKFFSGKFTGTGFVELMMFDAYGTMILFNYLRGSLNVLYSVAKIIGEAGFNQSDWQLSQNSSFYVGDIDGDGFDEILILNASATAPIIATELCIVKWKPDTNDFRVIWAAKNGLIPGIVGKDSWPVYSNNTFYMGDIDGDGQVETLVYNNNNGLGVLKWNTSSNSLELLHLTNTNIKGNTSVPVSWEIGASDFYKLGDINGDGKMELFAFNGNEIGAIAWNENSLEVMGISSEIITGASQTKWPIKPTQICFVSKFDSSKQDVILIIDVPVLSPFMGYSTLGMVRWDIVTSSFDCLLYQVDNPMHQDELCLSPDANYTCADVDGDGIKELVQQSDMRGSLSYLKWNGASFERLLQYTSYSTTQMRMPCWGLGLISRSPFIGFSAFNSTAQNDIYVKLSNAVTGTTNDIRSLYSSGKDSELISALANLITTNEHLNQNPPVYNWDWMNLYVNDLQDLKHVVQTVLIEVESVTQIWAADSLMDSFFTTILNQQQADLKTVIDNLVPASPSSSSTTALFWVGQVVDAVLWGIVAGAGPEFSISLSIVASLFGSLMGSVNDTNTSVQVQVTYDELNKQLINSNLSAKQAYDNMFYNGDAQTPTGIVLDPVQLRVLNFSLNNWNLNSSILDKAALQSSNFNRYSLYKTLVKQLYTVSEGVHSSSNMVFHGYSIPGNAMLSISGMDDHGQGYADIYIIAQATKYCLNGPWPSEALTNELYDTYSISKYDFFNGNPPMNMTVQKGRFVTDYTEGWGSVYFMVGSHKNR